MVHLDGARLFNAAAALNTTPEQVARDADSVQVCFSKVDQMVEGRGNKFQGLGAPIGSILCGTEEFIARSYLLQLNNSLTELVEPGKHWVVAGDRQAFSRRQP